MIRIVILCHSTQFQMLKSIKQLWASFPWSYTMQSQPNGKVYGHIPQNCSHFWQKQKVWNVSKTPSSTIIHWEVSQNSLKAMFTIRIYNRERVQAKNQPKEEVYRVWEGSKCKASIVHMKYFSPSIQMWQYTASIVNKGSSLKLQCPEFLTGLHYTGIINWLTTWSIYPPDYLISNDLKFLP